MVREELFGRDSRIQKAIAFAREFADQNMPLLLMGENGVGKESLGIYIHQLSKRKSYQYLTVDCANDEKSVEDEILGHRDEETSRYNKGIIERANKGTILLKNIDGLSDDFQKKIYKIFHELNDYDIDVRIIATTTKNLSKLVGAGRFSRALYLLVSGHQIFIPPLRERKEDIKLLAQYFLENYARELLIEAPYFTSEAYEKLMNFYWTYNVLELKAVVSNSIKNMHDGMIGAEDLTIGEKKNITINGEEEDGIKLMSLKEAEKLLIKKALIHTSENRTQAAKILGVSIRTLRNKINEYRNDGTNYFVNLR
ncbi:MAG: sigma-54-dependent Fis family transcriptional regulator [Oligoflexia bacterium]|nr:sigma-54-dependent Fis family transcriptional regulator [Oligoflexia bacterium]